MAWSISATASDGPFTWTVPLDGTNADLATTTVYTGSISDDEYKSLRARAMASG